MKRRRSSRLVLVLAILALGAALTVMATRPHAPTATGPVYTLAQVEAGLSQHPQAWVGRTVLVRALLQYEPCPWRIANGYDAFKHISYYRYECYLAPAWVADLLHSHKAFTFPDPFLLAADPPRAPSFFFHSLPLVGRFVPLPRLEEVDGPLDTTPHVYRILLVPPRDCNRYTTGGLMPCPQARFLRRVS